VSLDGNKLPVFPGISDLFS